MRAALLAILLMLGAWSDVCQNTEVARLRSPGGQHEAVLFQRDCGATTGFSTQVALVEFGRPITGAGNVFRADDNHGEARAGRWGGPWAEMAWLSANRLVVRYAAGSRIFVKEDEVSGIAISYEAIGSTPGAS